MHLLMKPLTYFWLLGQWGKGIWISLQTFLSVKGVKKVTSYRLQWHHGSHLGVWKQRNGSFWCNARNIQWGLKLNFHASIFLCFVNSILDVWKLSTASLTCTFSPRVSHADIRWPSQGWWVETSVFRTETHKQLKDLLTSSTVIFPSESKSQFLYNPFGPLAFPLTKTIHKPIKKGKTAMQSTD